MGSRKLGGFDPPHNCLSQSKPKSKPRGWLMVAAFASMWISNVAAPVLCFSLFQPILRTMDVTTPFAKSLVSCLCLAGWLEHDRACMDFCCQPQGAVVPASAVALAVGDVICASYAQAGTRGNEHN
eukprot:1137785-Pelagomonas_calceolata.AAC.8